MKGRISDIVALVLGLGFLVLSLRAAVWLWRFNHPREDILRAKASPFPEVVERPLPDHYDANGLPIWPRPELGHVLPQGKRVELNAEWKRFGTLEPGKEAARP